MNSSQLIVKTRMAEVLVLSRDAYNHVYYGKLPSIYALRKQLLLDNFFVFNTWEEENLKFFTYIVKQRILSEGETLFEDGTRGENLFFLVSGSLRIEKEVNTEKVNYWPVSKN